MHGWKWSRTWAVTSVLGGLFFTSLSWLYVVKTLPPDAEIVYYGFPLAWLETGGGKPLVIPPWHYQFLPWSFAVDFVAYAVLTGAAIYVYIATTIAMRRKSLHD